jgi:hypothetical protein
MRIGRDGHPGWAKLGKGKAASNRADRRRMANFLILRAEPNSGFPVRRRSFSEMPPRRRHPPRSLRPAGLFRAWRVERYRPAPSRCSASGRPAKCRR